MHITSRQIARAARKLWGRYPDDAADGRNTIRNVLSALRIPHGCNPEVDLNAEKLEHIKNHAFAWSGGGRSAVEAVQAIRDVICGEVPKPAFHGTHLDNRREIKKCRRASRC